MKYAHVLRHALLFLSILSGTTFASDVPRAARALRRRKPEPGLDLFTCCSAKSTDAIAGSRSKFVGVSKDSTELETLVSRPERDAKQPKLVYPTNPKPYPTQLENPKLTLDGRRYVVAVIALSRDKKVMLIRDRRGPEGWRLPEGDWGPDENFPSQAVSREAWETAGIEVQWNDQRMPVFVGNKETNIWDEPENELADLNEPQALSHYYQFVAEEGDLRDAWPDQGRWERKWATAAEAKEALVDHHPEHWVMLHNSDMWWHFEMVKNAQGVIGPAKVYGTPIHE